MARPVITITGPAHNPVIENTTVDSRIEMEYNIAAGEAVTIDTLALTVTNNSGENLLPYTTGDVATFGLSPSPQAPDRINVIHASFSAGASGQSTLTMAWRNRYIGL